MIACVYVSFSCKILGNISTPNMPLKAVKLSQPIQPLFSHDDWPAFLLGALEIVNTA